MPTPFRSILASPLSAAFPADLVERSALMRELQLVRPQWHRELTGGRAHLTKFLRERGIAIVSGVDRAHIMRGAVSLPNGHALLFARLKTTAATMRKMARHRESLREMLDIWGYRIVVPDKFALDAVATAMAQLWSPPTRAQMTLRGGTLLFESIRDYRAKQHKGLSPATANTYDNAIHINRAAPWGICEIQVLTLELYLRAFKKSGLAEDHSKYARRRRSPAGGSGR
jgi:hypothetical protein